MLGQIGSRWMDRFASTTGKGIEGERVESDGHRKSPRYNAEHGLTANHETRHGAWRIGR